MTTDWWQVLGPVVKNAWPYISLIALLILLKISSELKLPQKLYRNYKYKNRYVKHKTAHKSPPVMKSHGTEPTLGSGTGSADTKEKSLSERLIAEGGAYVAKKRFMSPSEHRFFLHLQSIYGEENYVFAQVRLVDVINPCTDRYKENSKEWLALFRQVSQWHLDFAIVDKRDCHVVCVYELDDKTHLRKDRLRRDKIFNVALKSAGINFYRVKI